MRKTLNNAVLDSRSRQQGSRLVTVRRTLFAFVVAGTLFHLKRMNLGLEAVTPLLQDLLDSPLTFNNGSKLALSRSTEKLWIQSTSLPNWMKEYFEWHRERRALLNESNWMQTQRFLIMECPQGGRCGDATDRLRPLPLILRIAHETQRLVLIRWQDPFPLEEFLVPPEGGMDWRAPDYIKAYSDEDLKTHPHRQASNLEIMLKASKSDNHVIYTKYLSANYGEPHYNLQRAPDEPSLDQVFRDMWMMLFQLSPGVTNALAEEWNHLQLEPGEYVAVEMRMNSASVLDPTQHVTNAMDCATSLLPGGPYLIATDTPSAVETIRKYVQDKNVTIAVPSYFSDSTRRPLNEEWTNNTAINDRKPADFYHNFVSIYLLGSAQCVAYGLGGFGEWGRLLGLNPSCSIRHANKEVTCKGWNEVASKQEVTSNESLSFSSVSTVDSGNSTRTNNLWDVSTTLPSWLKDYFVWHREQKAQLNETNWESRKFLIMEAPMGHLSGGLTDRLRPVPAMLRVAAESKRIMLLYWQRPFALEEFLVPPPSGMDWRAPQYMREFMDNQLRKKPKRNAANGLAQIRGHAPSNAMIVFTQYQSWNYGELDYDSNLEEGEAPVLTVFRDVWNTLFTPSPGVAASLEREWKALGLIPGEYAYVHFRVEYGKSYAKDVKNYVKKAMNCISMLRPGGPYLVSADTNSAVDFAREYVKNKNVTIMTPTHFSSNAIKRAPLHLGRSNTSIPQVPADYYDSFVDIYLAGSSRCSAYGRGGFGQWGRLLGYNQSCYIKHIDRQQKCDKWISGPSS